MKILITGVHGFVGSNLVKALSKKGHTLQELTNCIQERIDKAGPGTRAGVVEAGVGLLECTMNMTGGYTYPYDHRGGWVGGNLNPDIMKFDSVDQLLDLAPKNNEKNRQNRPRRRQMEQWR